VCLNGDAITAGGRSVINSLLASSGGVLNASRRRLRGFGLPGHTTARYGPICFFSNIILTCAGG
jgi:hypothetical protein